MRAGYADIDPEAEYQARSLGARPLRAFLTATVPALRPSLLAATIISFLVGWSDYVITVVVGGGHLMTVPMLLAAAMSGAGNESAVAAMALALLAPYS
ncbi:MAG: ABC transporter permease [Actinomycetales bacterium]